MNESIRSNSNLKLSTILITVLKFHVAKTLIKGQRLSDFKKKNQNICYHRDIL